MTTGVVKSLTRSAGKRPRRWLRWIGVLLVLLAAYALAGFALVPWLVKTKLPEFAMSDLQRRAAVGDVRFNPFKLYFEARDLKLDEADGTPIVALDQLVVDLGWDSLTRRAWSFTTKLPLPKRWTSEEDFQQGCICKAFEGCAVKHPSFST